jgi:hypothetical protein
MQDNQPQKSYPAFQPYLTVKQLPEQYPAFTEGGLRHNIFHASSNGLKESGAIVRNGRRILVNVQKYFDWLESQQEAPQ